VDYLGIASDLKEALSFYSASGGRGDPAETQELAAALYQKIREYGYPPDMEALATETVLQQAEMIADELTGGEL
jgi:type I restriction enzyme R subunit